MMPFLAENTWTVLLKAVIFQNCFVDTVQSFWGEVILSMLVAFFPVNYFRIVQSRE